MRVRPLSKLLPPIAVLLLALAWVCPMASAQVPPPRTVLAINWGAEDFPGTPALNAAIREAVRSGADAPVNYFAEYLESEAFPLSSPALRDYIRKKFANRRIDVVIAITVAALDFALLHRAELFPDAPIVFSVGTISVGVANRRIPGVTGVVSDVTFAETLEVALRLHPSVRRVFVVAQAPAVPNYREGIRAALSRFSGKVELTFMTERTVPRLLAAISALPPESLILYTRYTPEGVDDGVDTVEVARLMVQRSPVPIYSPNDLYMGTGVVGGVMRNAHVTGTRVGAMVRQILDGTRPEDIPIERANREPTFDWRQVRRWRIDASLLPAGSDIQFRAPSAWQSYRWYILGTVAIVAAQLLLIAGLLTQRARKRTAENTVREREATLRVSYERIRQLAGRLINAQEAARAGIAQDLHDDVCQRLVYVSMAVSSLKSSSGDIQDVRTQEAFSELERDTVAMFDGLRRLSHDLHPATLRVLGLAPALKTHCVEVEKRHAVEVSFNTGGEIGGLHPDLAVCLFRITQEALRNGVIHGQATRLAVSLTRTGDDIELTVTDNGRGFDLEAVRREGRGLGLVSMEERAHVIGGDVQIVTGPGLGTTVRVRGPAERSDSAALPDANLSIETPSAGQFPAVG